MIKKLLPPSLNTEPFSEIAEGLGKQLQKVWEELINVVIYPRIDEIEDEQLLDLLGWQFHIEGWELAKTIEEKRNLVKNAIKLHRYKGTPYAIKKVLEALNLEGQVREWFEYKGQPYRFKVEVNSPLRQITPELRDKLLKLIEEYKNERSWLEEIILSYLAAGTVFYGAGAVGEQQQTGEFVDTLKWTAAGAVFCRTGAVGEQRAIAVMEV
jgi:phage tail P2-like protein